MTHITIERAKLEQWREALQKTQSEGYNLPGEAISKAITAIDAALAQPAQEPDHGDELTIAYLSGVHRGKELAAQPPQQRPWVGLTEVVE